MYRNKRNTLTVYMYVNIKYYLIPVIPRMTMFYILSFKPGVLPVRERDRHCALYQSTTC